MKVTNEASDSQSVSQKNDLLRSTLSSKYGKVILTKSISAHPLSLIFLKLVMNFNDFNSNNDPYGEHDCAIINLKNDNEDYSLMFKIDYYDKSLIYGCEPTDPDCVRVLTIMFSDER